MIQQPSFNQVQAAKFAGTTSITDKTPSDLTKSFGDFLQQALDSVNAQEKNAHAMTDKYMLGQADVSEVMIASEQALLSLQFTSQIRDKVVSAYQEIMRMQL